MARVEPENVSKHLTKKVKAAQKRTLKKWKRKVGPLLKTEIRGRIAKGQSPVEGIKTYQKYSPSYEKAIKRTLASRYGKKIRPINLSLSGRMLKSLAVRATIAGVVIYFTNPIHKYHNGKGRVRRATLPLDGERFKRPIKAKMKKLYKKLFKIK